MTLWRVQYDDNFFAVRKCYYICATAINKLYCTNHTVLLYDTVRNLCLICCSGAQFNESVCFKTKSTASPMILRTYTFSYDILVRCRPESIALQSAHYATSVHIAGHVISCRPMSVQETLQSYKNKPCDVTSAKSILTKS